MEEKIFEISAKEVTIEVVDEAAGKTSKAIVVDGVSNHVKFGNLDKVLSREDTSMRIFGKGELNEQK